MKKRPVIHLKPTAFDKSVDILSGVVLLITWLVVTSVYFNIPDLMPIDWGWITDRDSDAMIVLVPIVSTILYFGLTVACKFPHRFNYLMNITEHNAAFYYRTATTMLRWLKLGNLLLLLTVQLLCVYLHPGNEIKTGPGVFILLAFILQVPAVYYMIRTFGRPDN